MTREARRQPMQSKRQYSEDFKKDAIRLRETSGKKLSEIERELGIPHGLLRKWQQRFEVNPVSEKLELSEVEQLKAQLREVRRELEITRMERDILKKTVGIFSKETRP
jgi:transposase